MKLGARHRPAPAAISPLRARLAFSSMLIRPPARDWHAAYPANGDALGNDKFGCCVEAAIFNTIAMRRANAWHDQRRPTENQVFDLYQMLTGFDPLTGLPDDGTDTVAAMTVWCVHGVSLDPQTPDVPKWTTVEPTNIDLTKTAIALLGPVQATFNLPSMTNPAAEWSDLAGAPGSWGMHRVCTGKYDAVGFTVRSWGHDVAVTNAFWQRYCVAVDVTLSREWLGAVGAAGPDFDWDALEVDLQRLAAA